MQVASNNRVVEWKVNSPKKKTLSKKIIINWMVIFKILIPVLLYSWIYFNDFKLTIPIGKNSLAIQARNTISADLDGSINWPQVQYWEIDDEIARLFIHQNTAIVQSLEVQNHIPAGVQMAIGLLNIQNFKEHSAIESKSSYWKSSSLFQKWNNQGKAISHLFLEKGQIPDSHEDWYLKIVESFNQQSEGAGFLVQNLIALYDLKKLDLKKS